MGRYIDMALTLEILKQDSGLLPKPNDGWNVFEPQDGDIAFVNEDNQEYIFKEGDWEPYFPEEEEENHE